MVANLTSFIILALFLYGRSLRFKNLKLHIRLMLVAFAGDLILVLALVMMKDALSKVSLGMHWTLKVHIPFALGTIVLYMIASYAGYRLYRGDESARPVLRRSDRVLLFFRIMTLVTSLMVSGLRIK